MRTSTKRWLGVMVAGALVSAIWLLLAPGAIEDRGLGDPEVVARAYQSWSFAHENNGGDSHVVLSLGWVEGLSSQPARMRGEAVLDLLQGKVTAGVPGGFAGDVWLVDNQPGPGMSVKPERGDRMVRLGSLEPAATGSALTVDLGSSFFRSFELDWVVVTGAGGTPSEEGVLFGAPSLFQRRYTGARLRWVASPYASKSRDDAPMWKWLAVPRLYASSIQKSIPKLVSQGRTLFLKETFGGNGRTCGTCHPPENNFTIDPAFIATLPPNDPLFVAEFVPELAVDFENPTLMRSLGLILENADGMDDLATKFVMRGVPHTLALSASLTPGADGTTTPPDERTGWSGDGAPGNGTLREFAIGAVIQHFPRTLARVPGTDFRLPTDEELDAMAAFQLSLGRESDPDLASLVLRGVVPERGLEIFMTTDTEGGTVAAGKCQTCHANGGANLAGTGLNFNFDTGVESLPDQPADLLEPSANPPDGGFGTAPHPVIFGAFGNGTFNTPPLVEAADTPPFFHNNAIRTLEQAVAFYNSDAFNNSAAGRFLASVDSGAIGIRLEATQVEAVAAFLRVLNGLENIREALELLVGVDFLDLCFGNSSEIDQSVHEIEDAIEVLDAVSLHPPAVSVLREAKQLALQAQLSSCFGTAKIEAAKDRLELARGEMIVE